MIGEKQLGIQKYSTSFFIILSLNMKDILYKQKEGRRQYSVLQNCKQLCQHSLLERSIPPASNVWRTLRMGTRSIAAEQNICIHMTDQTEPALLALPRWITTRRHDPQSSLQTCKTKKIDSCLSHIREESWRNTGPGESAKQRRVLKDSLT